MPSKERLFTLYIQKDNSIDCGQIATGTEEIVLVDKDKNGKVRPWKEKKLSNISYYELLAILQFKKAERVSMCGEVLEFNVDHEGKSKLAKAWFCKSSLCPICNWRKSMKHTEQAKKVVAEVVRRKPTARWLFLTLSVRNAYDGEDLDKSLKQMAEGFRRLMMYKKIAKNLIGFMRTTEVTVNEEDGTYNQHMHVLVCVKASYFAGSDNYISQEEWTDFWQKAMKLVYRPIVHVEAVKDRKGRKTGKKKDGLIGSIYETAKYSVKDSDYLTGDSERDTTVVRDLEMGLYRKRLISYGGLLKEVHKELNLDNVEDGDLVHVDDENDEVAEKAYSLIATWNWKRQNYFVRKGE